MLKISAVYLIGNPEIPIHYTSLGQVEQALLELNVAISRKKSERYLFSLCRNNKLFVGNIGDSRCIACCSGLAEALSIDHKPGDALERDRIENAGGFVEFNRVNGNLALSRAFGDFAFKNNIELPQERQMISMKPDVVVHEVGEFFTKTRANLTIYTKVWIL